MERSCHALLFWENQIKEKFKADWNFHLTKNVKGEYKEYAIIIQACQVIDFRNPGRGEAIACSLFTNNLQKLYQNRSLGYVYDLNNRDIILAINRTRNSRLTFDP